MSQPVAGLSADLSAADLRPAILRATLDQVSASTSTGDGERERDCCVICLGDLTEPCESQPCQHAHFDYLCLLTWLDQRKTCPLCKVPITDVRHNFSPNHERWDTHKVPEGPAAPQKTPGSESHPSRDARPFRRRSRPHPTGRPYTSACASRRSDSLAQRRHVYRHRLFSLHVGTRQRKPHCDLTPARFVNNPDLVSRSRMFLRRELQVFEFLSSASDAEASLSGDASGRGSTESGTDPRTQRRMANVEFLLEYIISILKTIDTQGCMGQAEALISPFLGREHTQLLLHELRAFLRSPYITLESWDRNVQYLSPSRSGPTRAGRAGTERDVEPSDNTYPSVWRRGDPL